MDRVRRLKTVLWFLTGVAAAVGAVRFITGLGVTTNLSDSHPWGFWIGFDVMGGVALAAGGFVITAIVYVFKREQFHPIVKPAVLTAFLGYIAVILGLLFDLGLPWNIWHMIIYWNPHSPLFEVGWCVMLYTAVLLLEFSPVPLEPFSAWARIRRFLIRYRIVLVVLGIGLSTLHQSSLGSLFLIMPYKVHALWYTPILPILFFISAVMLGLYIVTWESKFTAWAYRRQEDTDLVAMLQGSARWVALVYIAVRFGDLAVRGELAAAFAPGPHTWLFWAEIVLMAALPFALSLSRRVLRSTSGQWAIASTGVFGVVFNRVNVGGLAHVGGGAETYVPNWTEFVISAGVVSFVALVFLFIVEHFRVWAQRPADPAADPEALPEFEPVSQVSLGGPAHAARVRNSMAFIIAAAVGFALMPFERVERQGLRELAVKPALGGDTLFVDGNRDGYGVFFRHQFHVEKQGGRQSCANCHHMNLPGDRNSECSACHREMYRTSDAFRHQWHASPEGGNVACADCHDLGKPKSAGSVFADRRDCDGCHPKLAHDHKWIEVERYGAVASYADAMHGLCVECHRRELEAAAAASPEDQATASESVTEVNGGQDRRELTLCTTCHRGETLRQLRPDVMPGRETPAGVVRTQANLTPWNRRASRQEKDDG
ncbi:MAG: putative Ni/Fe-hydrogenase 2 b-type cytochrome subunit [Calditrichaeota bacterium]|nr:putative Ni/Fe-hydrogenase 2 b-type cytochrome subunit [Calditrichota bacterium]